MHNEKDDIELLFSKKFEKFEVKSSEKEWLDLSSKLTKLNFLKFSFVSFNVYYLMVMVTFAGTSTFLGIRNIQLSKEVEKLEQSLQSYQKKEQPGDDASATFTASPNIQKSASELAKPNGTTEIKTETKKKTGPEIRTQVNKPEVKAEPLDQTKPEVNDVDIKPVGPAVQPDSATETRIRKVVRKTYIFKPKSVIVKDTVVLTKSVK